MPNSPTTHPTLHPPRLLLGLLSITLTLSLPITTHANPNGFWTPGHTPHNIKANRALREAQRLLAQHRDISHPLQTLLSLQPKAPWTLYLQALHTAQQGDTSRALNSLQSLLQHPKLNTPNAPSREVVLADIALLYTTSHAFPSALEYWNKALQANPTTNPNTAVYLTNIAEIHHAQQKLTKSIETYTQALRISPNSKHALAGLILALEEQHAHTQPNSNTPHPQTTPTIIKLLQLLPNGSFPTDSLWLHPAYPTILQTLIFEARGQTKRAQTTLNAYTPPTDNAPFPPPKSLQTIRKRLSNQPSIHIASAPLPFPIRAASTDPKGRYVALAGPFGLLALTRLTPNSTPTIPLLSGPEILTLAFTPNGETLLIARRDRTIRHISTKGRSPRLGPVVSPLHLSHYRAQPLQFSPDASLLIATTQQRYRSSFHAFIIPTPQPRSTTSTALPRHTSSFNLSQPWAVHIPNTPPHQPHVASLQNSKTLNLTKPNTNQSPTRRPTPALSSHTIPFHPTALAFHPSGEYLLATTQDTLWIFHANTAQPYRIFALPDTAPTHPVLTILPDPKGSAGFGPALLLFDQKTVHALRWESLFPTP